MSLSFAGCDGEGDVGSWYYTSKYPLPVLSMIADCGFVCYGEKGILRDCSSGRAFSDECWSCMAKRRDHYPLTVAVLVVGKRTEVSEGQLAALQASLPECVKAEAGMGKSRVTAYGTSRHSASPEGECKCCP